MEVSTYLLNRAIAVQLPKYAEASGRFIAAVEVVKQEAKCKTSVVHYA